MLRDNPRICASNRANKASQTIWPESGPADVPVGGRRDAADPVAASLETRPRRLHRFGSSNPSRHGIAPYVGLRYSASLAP